MADRDCGIASEQHQCGRFADNTAAPQHHRMASGNGNTGAFKKNAEEGSTDPAMVASHLVSAAAVVLQYKPKGREKEADAIFERFHRGDPARAHSSDEGSGLGLTIARAIAIDHGGSLTAHSPGPGCGTTFVLALPWSPPPRRTG